jgi:hypothetical protein
MLSEQLHGDDGVDRSSPSEAFEKVSQGVLDASGDQVGAESLSPSPSACPIDALALRELKGALADRRDARHLAVRHPGRQCECGYGQAGGLEVYGAPVKPLPARRADATSLLEQRQLAAG